MSVVIVLFLAVNSIPVVYGENGNVDHTDTEEETVSPSITFHLPEGDGSVRGDGQIWYKNNPIVTHVQIKIIHERPEMFVLVIAK